MNVTMNANIDYFLQLVDEIEANSWWRNRTGISGINPGSFTFSVDVEGSASITDVPSELFESLQHLPSGILSMGSSGLRGLPMKRLAHRPMAAPALVMV